MIKEWGSMTRHHSHLGNTGPGFHQGTVIKNGKEKMDLKSVQETNVEISKHVCGVGGEAVYKE